MHPFVGRTAELENLHKLFGKETASLVVIHGRRGIGKSRLAQQFASSAPHYIFSGVSRAADQKKRLHSKWNMMVNPLQLPGKTYFST